MASDQNIYANVESSVLVNEERTKFFPITIGLRQGCILSPLLFDLLNGLVDVIKRANVGIQYGNEKIALLLFADDIVLMAETKQDLPTLMDITYEFSQKWRFNFNYDKCAVMVFQFKRRLAR